MNTVRNLGVWFDVLDSDLVLMLRRFVVAISLRCVNSDKPRSASHVKSFNALVGNSLDYCGSLFRSKSKLSVKKLECVQNSIAKIITNIELNFLESYLFLKIYTGCLLNNVPFSKLSLLCTSTSTLVF